MVSLKDEVKYIKDYLNLLNLRFDYKITLSLKIPEEFLNTQIPKMSLQPLVENSVYHGIENLAEDTVIYIKVFTTDGIINIEVSDMGVGMSEETLNELRQKTIPLIMLTMEESMEELYITYNSVLRCILDRNMDYRYIPVKTLIQKLLFKFHKIRSRPK